jgi:hypothetical protein
VPFSFLSLLGIVGSSAFDVVGHLFVFVPFALGLVLFRVPKVKKKFRWVWDSYYNFHVQKVFIFIFYKFLIHFARKKTHIRTLFLFRGFDIRISLFLSLGQPQQQPPPKKKLNK